MPNQNNYDFSKLVEKLVESTNFLQSDEWKQATASYRQMLEGLGEAVRSIYESASMQMMRSLSEQMQAFAKTLPKIEITIPKIEISEETKESIRRIRFLRFLEKVEWPLFLMIDEDLMNLLEPYIDEKDPDFNKVNEEILGVLSNEYVEKLCDRWTKSSVVNDQRRPLLKEAYQLFVEGFYYGCTSLLTCQFEGLVSDFYKKQTRSGLEISEDNLKVIYEHYNPNKTFQGNLRMSSEKNQLLAMATLADSGFFYWNAVIGYLYKIVLTSDEQMDQSNHPCRNKICHGIQLNHGTREHAVKSILITDMTIKLGEDLERILNECDCHEE